MAFDRRYAGASNVGALDAEQFVWDVKGGVRSSFLSRWDGWKGENRLGEGGVR